METPINAVPIQLDAFGSVHRYGVQLVPSVHKALCPSCFKGSPVHVSTLTGPPHSGLVSGQLSQRRSAEGADPYHHRVSCCLSAAGLSFLDILSRRGIPPLLRSAYQTITCRYTTTLAVWTTTRFPRFTHSRCDRIGRPLYPETHAVLSQLTQTNQLPRAPFCQGHRSYHPGPPIHHPELEITRRHRGVHLRSPARSSPGL
jgi:hypothetical protein